MTMELATIVRNTPAVVCVCGIGVNGLGIVRSLGRAGIDVYVIVVSDQPCITHKSRYCKRSISVAKNDGQYICNALIDLADELHCQPVLYFDNDKMMISLAKYIEIVESRYHITSDLRHANQLTDKEYQLDAAAAAGLLIPKTWYPKSWNDFDDFALDNARELIAKPSPAHFGAECAMPFKTLNGRNALDLRDKLKKILESPIGIIVQEYVAGGDEQIHIAMSYRNRLTQSTNSVTVMKIRQSSPGAGVMAVGRPARLPEVRDLTHKYLEYLDIDGLSETEFKHSATDNKYYFIECNPRTALFHTAGLAAGFDLPLIAHHESMGLETDLLKFEQADSNTCWVYAHALLNFWIRSRGIQFSFKECKGRKRVWAVFSSDDIRPWLHHLRFTLSELFRSVRRKILS
jgi:predicted ATP-grasp superfamily ATP-dependent carboligase